MILLGQFIQFPSSFNEKAKPVIQRISNKAVLHCPVVTVPIGRLSVNQLLIFFKCTYSTQFNDEFSFFQHIMNKFP